MRAPLNELPSIIKENGFDFDWSNEKVWSLNVPVEDLEISELEWMFNVPFWSDVEIYDTTPRQVIEFIDSYPEHKDRILNADISYPIDIMKNQNDKWLILDGLHRLTKLFMEGNNKVKVRKFSRKLIPEIKP